MTIMPPVILLLAIALMTLLHFLWPLAQMFYFPLTLLGVVLMLLGLGTILWCGGLFRLAGTTIKPFQESSHLITSGIYGYSRNPIYLAMVVILIGVAWLCGSFTPFFVIPFFKWGIETGFILREEQMLQERFGESYQAYCQRVRRWF